MGPIVGQACVQLLHEIGIVSMVTRQPFMPPHWLVQVLYTPQKFERPSFWNGWSYEIKHYGVEVTFNCMNFLLNP
jgi:hypothetical protein